MEIRDELVKIVGEALKRADLKKIKNDVIDRVLEPALDKLVNDTSLPIDDIIKNAIYPKLEEELKKMLDKEIDEILSKL